MFNLVAFLILTDRPVAPALLFWSSFNVVPERYEMKAGKMGRMQGEKNEPAPASADTSTFTSTTIIIFVHKCINSFIQITSSLIQDFQT